MITDYFASNRLPKQIEIAINTTKKKIRKEIISQNKKETQRRNLSLRTRHFKIIQQTIRRSVDSQNLCIDLENDSFEEIIYMINLKHVL